MGALLIVAMPSLAMVQEPGLLPSSGESANNRPARASTGLSNPADDVKAIRAMVQDFVAAFNRGDAKGVAVPGPRTVIASMNRAGNPRVARRSKRPMQRSSAESRMPNPCRRRFAATA